MSDDLVPYGYAPGSYQVFCGECGELHTADKRARRCLECAEKRSGFVDTLIAEARDRISALEAKNRELALEVLAAEGQAADAHQAQLAAEAKLPEAIKAGMHIATTAPLDGLQDAFDAALAELKGGE